MIIRKAEIADAESIARVHIESWRTTYKGIIPNEYLEKISYEEHAKIWKSILSGKSNEFYEGLITHVAYVVENKTGDIVGYISGGQKGAHNGELKHIHILKKYQHQGLCRKMVSALVQYLLNIKIESMDVNVYTENSSRLFYEKLGARKICEHKINKELNALTYRWEDISILK